MISFKQSIQNSEFAVLNVDSNTINSGKEQQTLWVYALCSNIVPLPAQVGGGAA